MKNKWLISTSQIFIVCCMILCACQSQNPEASQAKTEVQKPNTNTSPPASSASKAILDQSRNADQMDKAFPYDIMLKDAKGNEFTSSEVLKKGKPVILLFWLTTCPPCKIEMREILKKYEGWKTEADFELYAISTDWAKNYAKFAEMVDNNNWPWESFHDMNREFRKVMPGGLNGLPQSFVIDKDGKIVYHKRKYRMGDEDMLFAEVKSLQ